MFSFFLTFSPISENSLHETIFNKSEKIFSKFPIPVEFVKHQINTDLVLTTIEPFEKKVSKLHHFKETENHFFYIFGDLFGHPGEDIANLVYTTWEKGGNESLQRMDGNFTILIFTKKDKSIQLICDALGNRRVHYYQGENCLIVSPHDVIIFASGLVTKKIRTKLIYEMLAYIQNRMGESLLQDVGYQKPYETLTFANNSVTKKLYCPYGKLPLLNEKQKQKETIRTKINYLREHCKAYLPFAKSIEFDLTAGKDTRSVLILLYDLVKDRKISSRTMGNLNSEENKVAEFISQKYKIPHHNISLEQVSAESFENNLSLYALFCNGDTNGIRALETTKFQDIDELRFGGVRTTPEWFLWDKIMNREVITNDEMIDYVLKRYYKFPATPEKEMKEIRAYLTEMIKDFRAINSDNEFIMKALVLYLLFSNSGILINQRNWQLQNIEPLLSNDLTDLYFQIPMQDSFKYPYYQELFKMYDKDMLKLNINGNFFHRLDFYKNQHTLKCVQFMQKVHGRINRLKGRAQKLNFQDSVGYAFKTTYSTYIRETLISSEMVKQSYISEQLIKEMLDNHFKGVVNHQDHIGILLVIDAFFKLLNQIESI